MKIQVKKIAEKGGSIKLHPKMFCMLVSNQEKKRKLH